METMKKESKQPVISVIMPAYQAKQYIGQAIASVQNQTCKQAWELLVIDDCSTDDTMEAVRAYAADPRIHYVRQRKTAESRRRATWASGWHAVCTLPF